MARLTDAAPGLLPPSAAMDAGERGRIQHAGPDPAQEARDVEISAREIERQWGIANAEGGTTAVCKDSDTPEQAARRLGLRHIRSISSHDGGIVAGLTQQGRLLAIGDNYGPMA